MIYTELSTKDLKEKQMETIVISNAIWSVSSSIAAVFFISKIVKSNLAKGWKFFGIYAMIEHISTQIMSIIYNRKEVRKVKEKIKNPQIFIKVK